VNGFTNSAPLIAAEKDHHKFQALVEELNRILDAKDQRLKDNLLGN
jgi:hypothetical protein